MSRRRMNAMDMILAALACVLLAGCITSPRSQARPTPNRYITYYDHREQEESWYYWGKTTYLCMNQPPAGDAEFWCKIANDESRKREARCLAAGIVFGGFVRAGFTSEMMRKAIPDPRWLKNCTLGANVVVGGRWPYSISSGTHFYLIFFPEQTNSSKSYWSIDFTLSTGTREDFVSVEDAAKFLNGTLTDKRVQIEEFIMMYPLPGVPPLPATIGYVEEMHNRRGVGIKVVPDVWFEMQ